MKCKHCGLQIHKNPIVNPMYGTQYGHDPMDYSTCSYANGDTNGEGTGNWGKWIDGAGKPLVATPMADGQTEPSIPTPSVKSVPVNKPLKPRIVYPETIGRKFRNVK